LAYGRSKTANALFAVEFDRRHRDGGVRAASVMPGNSLTELPRHFSKEDLQSMFEAFGKGRAEAGLLPPKLKDISQAAATTVWAAVVADGSRRLRGRTRRRHAQPISRRRAVLCARRRQGQTALGEKRGTCRQSMTPAGE
jgi:NAD(P)-dependent dehydrogenase (short-subunit alcohol dehydrogenase family)